MESNGSKGKEKTEIMLMQEHKLVLCLDLLREGTQNISYFLFPAMIKSRNFISKKIICAQGWYQEFQTVGAVPINLKIFYFLLELWVQMQCIDGASSETVCICIHANIIPVYCKGHSKTTPKRWGRLVVREMSAVCRFYLIKVEQILQKNQQGVGRWSKKVKISMTQFLNAPQMEKEQYKIAVWQGHIQCSFSKKLTIISNSIITMKGGQMQILVEFGCSKLDP